MRDYTEEEMHRMRTTLNGETGLDKIKRKAREEPFVPAGVALTCFALLASAVGVKTGNRVYTQHMFRLRVAAQGLTVMAMVGGSIYYQQMKNYQ